MTLTQVERRALIIAMVHLYDSGIGEPWSRLQSILGAHGISVTLRPRSPHKETFGWSRTVYVYAGQLEVIGFYHDTSDPYPDFCVKHFIYERSSWRNLWSPKSVELREHDDGPWWNAVRSLTTQIEQGITEFRAWVAQEDEIRKNDSAVRARREEKDRAARLRRVYKE
jgi:hypothetical protein